MRLPRGLAAAGCAGDAAAATTRGRRASTSSSPSSTATPDAACAARSCASGAWPTARTGTGNAEFRAAAPRAAARHGRARAASSRARCGCLPAPPPGRRPRLPARAPVADVRRDAAADAGARAHPAAAAVPRGLEPRPRHADRVPGGRRRRRRVHRQRPRHRSTRSRCATAACSGGTTRPCGQDGLVARGRRRRARLPRDGRRRLRARPRTGRTALATSASARRSSRRRSCATASTTSARGTGNVYALDLRTRRFRWIVPRSARRSPRAPRSPARTLYIGDYGGRLLALAPGSGRDALVCAA